MRQFIILSVIFGYVCCVTFKDCGKDAAKGAVKGIKITNCAAAGVCTLVKGTNVTVTVDFKAPLDAAKATTAVHGIIGGIPVPFPLPGADACTGCGLTCPLKKGTSYEYHKVIEVKNVYPSVRLVVKWEVEDSKGNQVFCFEVPAEIKADSSHKQNKVYRMDRFNRL